MVFVVSDISNNAGSCQDLFYEFFGLSFLFSGTLPPSLRRVVLFVPLKLCFDDHGSFVIFRSVSVRPRHLIDQTSTMITSSNSLCRERDAQSPARCATSHHVASRAVPRTNRTQTMANSHSRSATSSTNESPSCDPSQLWLCSCAGELPGVCTDAASAGCSVRPPAQPPPVSSAIKSCPAC